MGEKVILYTSDTCQRCNIVKKMLNIHSVKYEEVTDRQLIINMNIDSVPAIEIEGEIIDNYTNVLAWLQKNGYYSFEVNKDD